MLCLCSNEGEWLYYRLNNMMHGLTNHSMCLARGRTYAIPHTPIIKACDRWHISDIADSMDGHLVSMAVLRRDLVCLLSNN